MISYSNNNNNVTMAKANIGKGSQVTEKKKISSREGVIVSTDPKFPGCAQKWLVRFKGVKKLESRSSHQLCLVNPPYKYIVCEENRGQEVSQVENNINIIVALFLSRTWVQYFCGS